MLQAINLVVRLLAIAILARLLPKEAFGVTALALAITMVFQVLAQLDIRDSLIRASSLSTAIIRTSAIILGLSSLAWVVLIQISASRIEAISTIEDFSNALFPISIILFINSAIVIPEALLVRHGHGTSTVVAIVVSQVFGFLPVAVCLSFYFADYRSLVAGYLAESIILLIMLLVHSFQKRRQYEIIASSHKISWLKFKRTLRIIFRNSGLGILLRLQTQLISRIDIICLSLYSTAGQVGAYSRAQALAFKPTETLIGRSLRTTVFPALVDRREDQKRLQDAYRKSICAAITLIWPVSLFLILAASEVILLLLGADWTNAVVPFQALCIAAALRFSQRLLVTLSRAMGQMKNVAYSNFGYLVALSVVVVSAAQISLDAVAIAVAAVSIVFFVIAISIASNLVGLSLRQSICFHLRPALGCIFYGVLLFVTLFWLRDQNYGAGVIFVASVGFSIFLAVAVAFTDPVLVFGKDAGQLILSIRKALQKYFARI